MDMEVEMPVAFVPTITVTELLTKTLENAAKDLVRRSIMECGRRHGFDSEAECQALGLENVTLIRKEMKRKPKEAKEQGEQKVRKSKSPKEPKAAKVREIPLPFEIAEINCCQGLTYNHRLFTQCPNKRMENNELCYNCNFQCSKNASGLPDCGTVEQRMEVGPYEFKDSKGRSPIRYYKFLEKMKVSPEKVSELKLIVDPIHFEKVENPKKGAGRPKKSSEAIVTENVKDLFAKLTENDTDDPVFEEEVKEIQEAKEETKQNKKGKLSDEEKEAKKAKLEEERAIKKAEREAKQAAEKAEKDAKKAAEKALKEAEKAATKAQKEASKGSKKKQAEPVVEPPKAAVAVEVDEEEQPLTVRRKKINDKMYLISEDNVLYDPDTTDAVGIWDEKTKTIIDLPDDEDEDEVDEDDYTD